MSLEQYTQEFPFGLKTLRDTLVEILQAECTYKTDFAPLDAAFSSTARPGDGDAEAVGRPRAGSGLLIPDARSDLAPIGMAGPDHDLLRWNWLEERG